MASSSLDFIFPEIFQGAIDLSYTPDGRKALAVAFNGRLWEWDVKAEMLDRHVPGTLQNVSSVAIAPDGKIRSWPKKINPLSRSSWPPAR